MNSIAIDLGFFKIYWYSLIILLAVFTAAFIIYKELKKYNFSKDKFIDLLFYTVIFGLIGARIYYVLFNLGYYLDNPIEILEMYNGGLAIHGGLIAGLIYVYYYSKKNKYSYLKIVDIIVVGVVLAQAIGRWGNFFNQEAYGPVTTITHLKDLMIPNFIINGMNINGNYHIPTFYYESIWDCLVFITLLLIRKIKKLKVGQVTGCYLLLYSLGRIYIESLRTDSLLLGNIKMAQLVSIIMMITGIFLIFRCFIFKNKKYDLYHTNKIQ